MARMAPLSSRHNQEPQRSSTADMAEGVRGTRGMAFFQTWASHPPYNARVAASESVRHSGKKPQCLQRNGFEREAAQGVDMTRFALYLRGLQCDSIHLIFLSDFCVRQMRACAAAAMMRRASACVKRAAVRLMAFLHQKMRTNSRAAMARASASVKIASVMRKALSQNSQGGSTPGIRSSSSRIASLHRQRWFHRATDR